ELHPFNCLVASVHKYIRASLNLSDMWEPTSNESCAGSTCADNFHPESAGLHEIDGIDQRLHVSMYTVDTFFETRNKYQMSLVSHEASELESRSLLYLLS